MELPICRVSKESSTGCQGVLWEPQDPLSLQPWSSPSPACAATRGSPPCRGTDARRRSGRAWPAWAVASFSRAPVYYISVSPCKTNRAASK